MTHAAITDLTVLLVQTNASLLENVALLWEMAEQKASDADNKLQSVSLAIAAVNESGTARMDRVYDVLNRSIDDVAAAVGLLRHDTDDSLQVDHHYSITFTCMDIYLSTH